MGKLNKKMFTGFDKLPNPEYYPPSFIGRVSLQDYVIGKFVDKIKKPVVYPQKKRSVKKKKRV